MISSYSYRLKQSSTNRALIRLRHICRKPVWALQSKYGQEKCQAVLMKLPSLQCKEQPLSLRPKHCSTWGPTDVHVHGRFPLSSQLWLALLLDVDIISQRQQAGYDAWLGTTPIPTLNTPIQPSRWLHEEDSTRSLAKTSRRRDKQIGHQSLIQSPLKGDNKQQQLLKTQQSCLSAARCSFGGLRVRLWPRTSEMPSSQPSCAYSSSSASWGF